MNQIVIDQICPTTATKWLQEGALLVDVRENSEVKELAFDVTNIEYIPLSDFESHFAKLPKNTKLILACRSGARSLRAANYLLKNGYPEVANLEGGILRWSEKSFPTKGAVSNSSDCCSEPGCC